MVGEENLKMSKEVGPTSKCLKLPELEEKLEQIVRVNGEEEINKVRDRARVIAKELEMEVEFERLNKMIGALLSTNSTETLHSPVAIARNAGTPFDPARIKLFEGLFIALQKQEFKNRPEKNNTTKSVKNFAFFESYFSNYIEGTAFEIDEAKSIIETNKPLTARNEDSHDVLGTYHIVSNKKEMSSTPQTAADFLKIMAGRHKI